MYKTTICSRSTSSTARRCYASGAVMGGENRAISTRWRFPTRRAGARRSPTCCFIAANEDREMTMHRRKFLGTAAVGGLLAGLPAASWAADAFAGLQNLAKAAQPIGVAEQEEIGRASGRERGCEYG